MPINQRKCECSDPSCQIPHGATMCRATMPTTLYRVDMEDRTGVDMCEGCAIDAMETGLFSDEPNFYSR